MNKLICPSSSPRNRARNITVVRVKLTSSRWSCFGLLFCFAGLLFRFSASIIHHISPDTPLSPAAAHFTLFGGETRCFQIFLSTKEKKYIIWKTFAVSRNDIQRFCGVVRVTRLCASTPHVRDRSSC